MKRILVAVLLLAAFVGIGNSKNFSVVGVVVDSLENEPGVYTLTISGTGMRQRSIEFAVGDSARVCNLGRVCATSDAWRLFPALSLKRSAWWRRSLW